MTRTRFTAKDGFTLIELLVVILIIGILAAFLDCPNGTTYNGYTFDNKGPYYGVSPQSMAQAESNAFSLNYRTLRAADAAAQYPPAESRGACLDPASAHAPRRTGSQPGQDRS